jgi:DNA (cytosine-5)-methyltransferase 1
VDEQPTHLDLFSGIGGFALAARWAGFRTIGFCEIDKYCQKVLAKNFLADAESSQQRRQSWKGTTQVYADIRDLDGRDFRGVDLITGGFPCQPFSVAGKRRGKEDDRYLWPEMLRVIAEAKPTWIVGENVNGIVNMAEWESLLPLDADGNAIGNYGDIFTRTGRGILCEILESLRAVGYSVMPFGISACGVDAPHRRNRVWIVGCAAGTGLQDGRGASVERSGTQPESQRPGGRNGGLQDVSDTDQQGMERCSETGNSCRGRPERNQQPFGCGDGPRAIWPPEPDVGRVAHGIPSRVDRLKGLGNAIVPQVAFQVLKVIYDIETMQQVRS